jgi:alpha-glucosidase
VAANAVDAPWWRDAVIYEIYIRSLADGSGDGIGDIAGIRSRLPYLRDLGVDAVWITPWYPSPMVDGGYDVANYRDIDPLFGTLAEAETLIGELHAQDMRLIIDLVPNHTSSQHQWFREALAAGPGSSQRARYVFRDGKGSGQPPNDWRSVFGGCAWTQVPDGQWYLHLFAPEQPDLNWDNPQVQAEFENILRFWLDRGVDGFRIDVAHGLVKDPDLPYLLKCSWNADSLRSVVNSCVQAMHAVGAPTTWVLSNHDVTRHLTRYGRPQTKAVGPIHEVIEPVDVELGTRRARAAMLQMLALPGSAYLYQGEELGLEEVEDLPEEVLQDPTWERSGRTARGRDGCRVPLPWRGSRPPFGFCLGQAQPWLPQPAHWQARTVDVEEADPTSMLSLYRSALRIRRTHPALGDGTMSWVDAPAGVLVFHREPGLLCVVNLSETPFALPDHKKVLLSSESMQNGKLATDTAAWLQL